MKTSLFIRQLLWWSTAVTGLLSCSDDREYPAVPASEQAGIPLTFSLAQQTLTTNELQYTLYVFSRSGDAESYTYESSIRLAENNRLRLSNADLQQKGYRFFFTATPKSQPEIGLVTLSPDRQPAAGDRWEDIRLAALKTPLSIDNYYQIKDIPGTDILQNDSIHGDLNRLVGQMEFRFFKISNDINTPVPINLASYSSIFDRIYKIDIAYTGFTTLLSFRDGQTPIAEASSTATLSQVIDLTLNEKTGIDLPQGSLDTLTGGAAYGGKIKGFYFLPADRKVLTTLTFHYYDTTPVCDKPDETHSLSCYAPKTLTLHIPTNQVDAQGLPVKANAYTVNKAGIRLDRIIDIQMNSNIDILTNWNTD